MNTIEKWQNWDQYFASEEGLKNLSEIFVWCLEQSFPNIDCWAKVRSFQRYNGMTQYPEGTLSSKLTSIYFKSLTVSELAVEMLAVNKELTPWIPNAVMDQIIQKPNCKELNESPLKDCLKVAIVLMAHGIKKIEVPYVAGDDECSFENVELFMNDSVERYVGDPVEKLCNKYDVDPYSLWNVFATDSGAGDGTCGWTSKVVVELMPEFKGYITDPEYFDYLNSDESTYSDESE
jgi:hypothetical protein